LSGRVGIQWGMGADDKLQSLDDPFGFFSIWKSG
jgi:hypothetical protein